MTTQCLKRHRAAKIVLAVVAMLLLAFAADNIAYPLYVKPLGPSGNRGENGLWISSDWATGRKTETDVLAARLTARQVRYAYVHVPGIQASGMLRPHSAASCRALVADLHRRVPCVKVIAWIFAGNPRIRGRVNLADPRARHNMAQEADRLVRTEGFDGIQWDYEICGDGDPDFLRLLDETRTALPPHSLLCVATPLWLPSPLRRWGWSDAYFSEVARRADQLAVMGYDTTLASPRAYVWAMSQQILHITRAVESSNPQCRVVAGVPTYKSRTLSHDPWTETLALAVIGVRNGLNDAGAAPSVFAGIALFADYTTSASDWRTYDRLWKDTGTARSER